MRILINCEHFIFQVMVASLKFFLGTDPDEEKNGDSEDSDNEPDLKGAMLATRVNKKTKKRQKQLANVKKQVVKASKKKKNAPAFNFSGIHFIHNPQGMAEALFKQLQSQNERFEVKLMHLDVISRLIGIHDLFLFPFYPYITRFLQPHQRQVTRVLQFAAQAAHELVPGDVVEPVLKTIANNFITERNSSDVMAIGLNATRAICARCPLAMGEDLLRDLTLYKTYKEKSVMMAAKSLITLYRDQLPALLHKKDRGRQTEGQVELNCKAYGESTALDHIPGAEALLKTAKTIDVRPDGDDGSDSEDWVDVDESGDEINIKTDSEDEDDSAEENAEDENASGEEVDGEELSGEEVDDEDQSDEEVDDEDGSGVEEASDEETVENGNDSIKTENGNDSIKTENGKEARPVKKAKKQVKFAKDTIQTLDEKQAAQELAATRIFTDEDFKRIDDENIRKFAKNVRKRPLEADKSEYVKLNDIEMIFKKRRTDKDSRMETVMRGREDREKFGYRDKRKNIHCSKTNNEKKKNKNFGMMRHKARSKVKRSFKDKQATMRTHLIKQKKMK